MDDPLCVAAVMHDFPVAHFIDVVQSMKRSMGESVRRGYKDILIQCVVRMKGFEIGVQYGHAELHDSVPVWNVTIYKEK